MKLSLILFFSTFIVIGQNIKGTILDKETKKPIENVTIYYHKEKTGTASDEKGAYNLKTITTIQPTDSLSFTSIGYESEKYTILQLKELNFIVQLSKKIENLDEVTITTNQKLKPKIAYTSLSPLKKGVYNFGSTLIGNKIYIIGGDESFIEDIEKKALDESISLEDFLRRIRNDFTWEHYSDKAQIYDIEKDTWETLTLKFNKRAYHKIIFLKDNIYVVGGKTLSVNKRYQYLDNKIEVLNLNTEQISIDNTNPHKAINFALFPYQDHIIVMGGSVKKNNSGKKIYTDQSHLYDVATGYWYELPKMTTPKEVNGVLLNNKIFLVGGFNKMPLSEIESFDLITGEWRKEGDLFYGIEKPALSTSDSMIYIFNNGKIMTYNSETKIINEYRIDLYLKNAQMYCCENKLYIIGGLLEDEFTKSPSSRLYSIDLNEFTKTEIVNSKQN